MLDVVLGININFIWLCHGHTELDVKRMHYSIAEKRRAAEMYKLNFMGDCNISNI